MKRCTKCLLEKPEEEFAWRKKGISRTSYCKACHRLASQKHYQENPDYYKRKAKNNRPAAVARSRAFIVSYLSSHPCVDCGEADINVLQFDHVEPLMDYRAPRVTNLLERSIERIQQEIDKCQVRCANCHLRRTRTLAGTLLR